MHTEEFDKTLRALWIFFWYRCGKILAPFIREQIGHLEKPFGIVPEVRELLLKASPATIDWKLKADKKKLAFKGKSGTEPGNLRGVRGEREYRAEMAGSAPQDGGP